MGFSATPGSKTPEPIAMKLGVRNCVQDPTLTSKYGSDRAAWGVSAHARNITVCDFLFSFLFFISSTHLQVATVDRFSRSIEPQEPQTGVLEVRQFTGVIEIYTRPTPVAMATKIPEI